MHWASQCPFRHSTCHACGKRGHIKTTCHSTPRQQSKTSPKTHQPNKVHTLQIGANNIFRCTGSSTPPMCVGLTLNKANVVMEVDSGASLSLLSESTYRRLWPAAATRPPLLPSDARLHTYSGELIKVLGTTSVTVRYRGQVKQLPLLIVPTDGPSLLGRDWLQEIVLDWKQLNKVHYVRQRALQDMLDQYVDLFKPGMGTLLPRSTFEKTSVHDFSKPDLYPTLFETKLHRSWTDCTRLT